MGNLSRQLVLDKSVLLASFRYQARLVNYKSLSPRMTAPPRLLAEPKVLTTLIVGGTIYPEMEKHRNGQSRGVSKSHGA